MLLLACTTQLSSLYKLKRQPVHANNLACTGCT